MKYLFIDKYKESLVETLSTKDIGFRVFPKSEWKFAEKEDYNLYLLEKDSLLYLHKRASELGADYFYIDYYDAIYNVIYYKFRESTQEESDAMTKRDREGEIEKINSNIKFHYKKIDELKWKLSHL